MDVKRCISTTCKSLFFVVSAAFAASCGGNEWPPDPSSIEPTSRVLTPDEALRSFHLPPGFRIELVASEPFVEDPVAIDFDADGRLYVAEMRTYMPELDATGETAPSGRVSVLVDDDGDGRMDRSTVFLDSLVLPRAVKAVDGGVLIGAPPHLIFARDTDGDLQADEQRVLSDSFGSRQSNPEYNPNGLVWGIDNCLHTTQHALAYCMKEGRLDSTGTPALFNGQWGVSMDDDGRLYRNFNEDPLRVDLIPAFYYARNPNLVRTRGAYENLVNDKTVWPIRPNRGVNRGYRDATLRDDGTLASFTAAGSPVVYRGDGFLSERRGDVFVTEPAGNLVRRFVLRNGRAQNAYDRAEFLTSSDERFRPVNLFSGPDGALYVIDMYRGVIQHTTYLTDYLKRHIREHDLQHPVGLGRIYRVVHESTETVDPPRLSSASTWELVDKLDHPNGWWRDTAQRLLVERRDTSEAALLRRLAMGADEPFTRLHALWTLDGLGIRDRAVLDDALHDEYAAVRAAAIRLSEPSPDQSGDAQLARPSPALLALASDPAPAVRRQLAASLGELPWPDRRSALAHVLAANPHDSVVVDLVVSGLLGYEADFIRHLARTGDARYADAVAMLAGAHASGSGTLATDDLPAWARDAAERGRRLGRPKTEDEGRSTSRIDHAKLAAGKTIFENVCAGCHRRDGSGIEGVAPSLLGSAFVTGPDQRLIRIVLDGKEGEQLMPPVQNLDDEEVAAVLTYVRRAWGHSAAPVDADRVDMVREITSDRDEPWTEEELLEIQ